MLRRGLPSSDFLVHEGLGEARLIKLVMAIETVPDHITESVLSIFLPVPDHEPAASDDCFRIAGVHSQHGDSERLDDVGRTSETSVISRVGRES